jgi:tRNA(Ile)-lysidine synthase
MFLDRVAQAITENCRLTKDQPVLVGVSGDADSLALMLALKMLGYKIVIAHLDHALRPESARDAEFVKDLATKYAVPFVHQRLEADYFDETGGQSLEEAARQIRYQFLFDQARNLGAQAVAVAHHADDQVETVLMHFLRGAALSGLSGMRYRRVLPLWDPKIPVVRPLLGIWRDEIDVFVSEAGLIPRVDESNADTTYFRNRLRHDLVPALQTYNPQIKQIVWQMADVLREEDRFLDNLSQAAWEECYKMQEHGVIVLKRDCFVHFSTALQRRVLRHAISVLRPDLRDIDFKAVDRAVRFAAQQAGIGEIDLVGRLTFTVLQDDLIVKTWDADLPDWGNPLLFSATTEARLDIDGVVNLRHGWRIQAKLIDTLPERKIMPTMTDDDHDAYLDFQRIKLPLQVRGRKPGDRWQPFGMGGHTQKLGDFFINEKVPEHLRDIWPLVCSGDKIIWVVGMRPSEAFKVMEETQQILHLQLVKPDH